MSFGIDIADIEDIDIGPIDEEDIEYVAPQMYEDRFATRTKIITSENQLIPNRDVAENMSQSDRLGKYYELVDKLLGEKDERADLVKSKITKARRGFFVDRAHVLNLRLVVFAALFDTEHTSTIFRDYNLDINDATTIYKYVRFMREK